MIHVLTLNNGCDNVPCAVMQKFNFLFHKRNCLSPPILLVLAFGSVGYKVSNIINHLKDLPYWGSLHLEDE